MTRNPVHYVNAPEPFEDPGKPGRIDSPGWYFWNETWSDRIGPFPTEQEAQKALVAYANSL